VGKHNPATPSEASKGECCPCYNLTDFGPCSDLQRCDLQLCACRIDTKKESWRLSRCVASAHPYTNASFRPHGLSTSGIRQCPPPLALRSASRSQIMSLQRPRQLRSPPVSPIRPRITPSVKHLGQLPWDTKQPETSPVNVSPPPQTGLRLSPARFRDATRETGLVDGSPVRLCIINAQPSPTNNDFATTCAANYHSPHSRGDLQQARIQTIWFSCRNEVCERFGACVRTAVAL
jgi:hypothetical protein